MELWMWIVLGLLAAAVFCWIMFFRKEKTFIYEPERGETPETLGLKETRSKAESAPAVESAPEPVMREKRPSLEEAEPALFDRSETGEDAPKDQPRTHDGAPETVRTSPTIGEAAEPDLTGAPGEEISEHEGDRPMLYDAPSEGPRDNLSALKGLGPALQSRLNRLGVYYFHQIAAWSESEAQWVDAEIKGQGRVLREDWPGQARKLMEPDQ